MIFYENVQTRFFARPKIITEKKTFFCIVERNFIVLIIVGTCCRITCNYTAIALQCTRCTMKLHCNYTAI